MAEEAFKEDTVSPNMIFYLDNILKEQKLKMRLIRNKNKTIGYLFWDSESGFESASKSSKGSVSYEGKTLNDILAEEEKNILKWAMDKAEGHISNAAKMIGVPRQTFGYKYKKYFKK